MSDDVSATPMTEMLELLDGAVCASLTDLANMAAPKPRNAWGHVDFRTRVAREWFGRWEELVGAGFAMLEAGFAEILVPADGCHPDQVGITTAGRRYLAGMRALP